MSSELLRFESPASVADWSAIDDRVMGGVSRSRLRYDPLGHAVFEGIVSLEHNGGFALIRSRLLDLGVPRVLRVTTRVGIGRGHLITGHSCQSVTLVLSFRSFRP